LRFKDGDQEKDEAMAKGISAAKRTRQGERRTAVNRARLNRMRTFVKKVEDAIAGGDREKARAAFRDVEPELARAARSGVIHRNAARRKLSRLAARIKAMAA
jgi:small subunit ribosomal protein S20